MYNVQMQTPRIPKNRNLSIKVPLKKNHVIIIASKIAEKYKCIWKYLKLLGPIFYQILFTVLNDGYDKYVYNNRHWVVFPVNLAIFQYKMTYTFLTKTKQKRQKLASH